MPAPPPDPTAIDRYLLRRARLRRAFLVTALFVLASALLGNLWQQVRGGDDWSRFDRRPFVVRSVLTGDRIAVEDVGSGRAAVVDLAGIDAPDPPPDGQPPVPGAVEAYRALRERAQGRSVVLALPPLGPRSPDGAVRAYVHIDGSADTANEQLVAEGLAYADRRVPHPSHKQFEQAEVEARRKRLGLWRTVRDDQQPAWRQEWLRRQRAEREQP